MGSIDPTKADLPAPVRLAPAAWQSRLDTLPDHSFFATPVWGAVLEHSSLGYQSYALELEAEGVRALLPVAERRLGPFRMCESMPFGTYGGLLPLGSPGEVAERRAAPVLEKILRRSFRRGTLFGTPGPHRHIAFSAPVESHSTSVIDLTVGSERLWANFEKDARNQVRQSERGGIVAGVENSLDAFREYYALLELTARRWSRTARPKPWALFESIATQAADPSSGIRLWLARFEGRLAAGALCFYGRGEVFQWSGAMDMEMSRLRPNNAIQWSVIKDAADSGFTTYNMGASAGLPNVEAFKKQFGAVLVDYSFYLVRGRLYNLTRKAAGALRRRRAPVAGGVASR